ncbi:MAG TPA: ABC transporter permease [Acidobacteriota bacterium]|nr:ABC transporter permease [Acidobacteriota bacterium]
MLYLVRRVVHALFLLLGVSLLSFALMQLAPGDFFEEMRLNPQISPQTITALRARYGMDRPFFARYSGWLKSLLAGDFGFSLSYNSPVASLLKPRIRNTLILTVTAILTAWLIAVPIGVWSASHRGSLGDRVCSATTSALLAIPDLVLALALLMLAVRTGHFPAGGMISVEFADLTPLGKIRDIASHLFLPLAALVLGTLPTLVRHVRAAIMEVTDAPFVRTAVAHGVSRRRILWRQVLPAAANPLISLFGLSLGTLLSASLIIEVIMSWPGLGPLLLEAILARDIYLVVGGVMISTLFLVAGNFLSDVMLYAVDPRIRKD